MPHSNGGCKLKYNQNSRSELLAFYYKDHDVVEDRLENFKLAFLFNEEWTEENRQILGDFITFLRHEVEHHLMEEEEFLFPHLKKALGDASGPIAVMNGEHNRLRQLIADLEREEAVCRDIDKRTARLDQLLAQIDEMLAEHMYKENLVLFPMAEQILTNEQKAIGLAGLLERRNKLVRK